MPSEREERLEGILAQILKRFSYTPFEVFIRSWFSHRVFQFDPEKNEGLFEILKILGERTCASTADSPIESTESDEVGNELRAYVKDAAKLLTLDIDQLNGSGYPDLMLQYNDSTAYIKVKSFDQDSANSKLRSFSVSPSSKARVTSDGFHLIIGFEVEQVQKRQYRATGFHLADAYGLDCSMNVEASSNNAIMYSDKQVLYSWRQSSESMVE